MNITVEQLLAKIGRLVVQVDFLIEENQKLAAQIKTSTSNNSENKPLTQES